MDDCIKRSVYGLGDRFVSLGRMGPEIVGSGHESRKSVQKSDGAHVGVQCFTDGSMPHISAILGSGVHAFCPPSELGQDFILYPNLTADNHWPAGFLPLESEYVFQEADNGWVGSQTW